MRELAHKVHRCPAPAVNIIQVLGRVTGLATRIIESRALALELTVNATTAILKEHCSRFSNEYRGLELAETEWLVVDFRTESEVDAAPVVARTAGLNVATVSPHPAEGWNTTVLDFRGKRVYVPLDSVPRFVADWTVPKLQPARRVPAPTALWVEVETPGTGDPVTMDVLPTMRAKGLSHTAEWLREAVIAKLPSTFPKGFQVADLLVYAAAPVLGGEPLAAATAVPSTRPRRPYHVALDPPVARRLALDTVWVRVELPGMPVLATDVSMTLREKQLTYTVDGLRKAVMAELPLAVAGSIRAAELCVRGPDAAERDGEPLSAAAPIAGATANRPYLVTKQLNSVWVRVELAAFGADPLVADVSVTLREKQLTHTVDGLRKAVIAELPLAVVGSIRAADLDVFPPGGTHVMRPASEPVTVTSPERPYVLRLSS